MSATLQASLSASALGKTVVHPEQYAPQLLFAVARSTAREALGLAAGETLPFYGEDIWNAYEVSWLNTRGRPQVALLELRVPAHSPYLIESKSLKLYLNSFNQTELETTQALAELLRRDLGNAAGADVTLRLVPLSECRGQKARRIAWPRGVSLDLIDIECARSEHEPQPEHLAVAGGEVLQETLYTHLLRSNCLVTGQPDWGTLFVRYRGRRIERAGLLRYIVSFRLHHAFHEHCVERIFMDITHRCAPARLEVWARYTRRGGIDINPYRSSLPLSAPSNNSDIRQ